MTSPVDVDPLVTVTVWITGRLVQIPRDLPDGWEIVTAEQAVTRPGTTPAEIADTWTGSLGERDSFAYLHRRTPDARLVVEFEPDTGGDARPGLWPWMVTPERVDGRTRVGRMGSALDAMVRADETARAAGVAATAQADGGQPTG